MSVSAHQQMDKVRSSESSAFGFIKQSFGRLVIAALRAIYATHVSPQLDYDGPADSLRGDGNE